MAGSGSSVSQEAVRVKEEPVEDEEGSRGASEAAARAGLCADRAVKDELGLGPEAPQPPDLTLATNAHIMEGADILKEETDCEEVESEWNSTGSCGVSAAAARAGLYAGHAVEGELVLGPEGPQPQDAVFALCALEQALVVSVCEPEPAPERGRGGEQPAPMDCSVRLERCARLEALLARATSLTTCVETESDMEHEMYTNTKVSTKKESFVCDICKRRFTLKSHLMKHVMFHIYTPTSTEREDSRGGVTDIGYRAGARAPARGPQPGPPPAAAAPGHEAAPRPECPTCHKQFDYPNKLERHIRIHTREKPFTCGTCKKQFAYLSSLKQHKLTHTGEKCYFCEICNKQFARSDCLKTHERIHTREKPYSCDMCKKQFTQLSSLIFHKRVHTGEKPYTCDICKKQFARSDCLKTHERIHTGEKPYSCDMCKKQFTQLSSLIFHKRVHTGEKPYTCDICKKQFARSDCLKTHERIHTGEKPYSCYVCKKQFTQLSSLIFHKRIHTGLKRYSCDICKKQFRHSNRLKSHKLTHTGEKRYT